MDMSNANASNSATELAPVDVIAAYLDSSQSDTPGQEGENVQATELDEGEQPEEEAEREESDEPEGQPFEEVELAGGKLRMTKAQAEEYRSGTLRQQDYTRKTQEVAEQRRYYEQQSAQIPQALASYQQRLSVLDQALRVNMPQPPSDDLNYEDPVEYARQMNAHQRHVQKLQAVMAEQQWTAQQQQQIEQQQYEQSKRDAWQRLPEIIPEWRDQKRVQAEQPKIWEYLSNLGYSPDELRNALDPRSVSIARKAWLFDQLQQNKQSARPVPPKTTAPSAGKPQNAPTASSRKDWDELRRSAHDPARNRAAARRVISRFLPKE